MQHLFLISIGPVQAFIASARRTRDLWFGSWLLSELSKAAAQEIVNTSERNTLIFPAPSDEDSLHPDSLLNVANKIVALIDYPPQQLGETVHLAIQKRLHAIRDEAFKEIGKFNQEAAFQQIDDLVEYFWVALQFAEGDNYEAKRKNIEALMAARKNTRDFRQVEWGSNEQKSSIDGQLESVIPDYQYPRRKETDKAARQEKIRTLYNRYSAGPVERLSGVDLLKRRGNRNGEVRFVSTSHIAAMPFLERLELIKDPAPAKALLNAYVEKIREIAKLQQQVPVIDVIPRQYSHWSHPILDMYDGSLLFEERLVDMVDDTTGFEPAKEALRAFYKDVDETIGKARPIPYYAILLGDGDYMGQVIDEQSKQGAAKHQELSQALDSFARGVPEIVNKHKGALIYAGGDDVLALVPLHTVLACAHDLANEFSQNLEQFKYNGSKSPTLSVGIAVIHHLHSLRDALDLARSAEKQAKGIQGKNALAIKINKRSGGDCTVAGRWNELDTHIKQLIAFCREDLIPDGAAYELRDLALRLTVQTNDPGYQSLHIAMGMDAKRILQRKLQVSQDKSIQRDAEKRETMLKTLLAMLSKEEPQGQEKHLDIGKPLRRVEQFANELIVAQFFADAMELANPTRGA